MKIWCCGCQEEVNARLTNGREIYPHREDLSHLPFWKCDACGNYVGTHYKTKDCEKPLGSIPTKELREMRKKIHSMIDPLWRSGRYKRGTLYKKLSDRLGYQFHSAEINTIEEAELVLEKALVISQLENEG